jgi:HEXXH motif-containing protein
MTSVQPRPGTHRVPRVDFDALASGYGDAAVVARLKGGQLSKHLLLVRALLDTAPPETTGWLQAGLALLTEVQETSPDIVSELMVHPQVGAWAAHCLRVLRGAESGDVPLDSDLGHLAGVAATAAIRAGRDFEIDVPVRAGKIYLPGLGAAVVGCGVSTVRVHGDAGRLVVNGRLLPPDLATEDAGWLPLRRLTATAGGLAVTAELDDLDPFRNCHRLAAASRLTAVQAGAWQQHLAEAWRLLVRHHRRYADAIAAGLVALVPLSAEPSSRGVSATSLHAFGATLISPPADGQALAVAIVHEFQHAKLGALLDLVPLHDDFPVARYYAPWRDDPRPLGGLLQGAYAYLGIADFWRVQRTLATAGHADFAQFEFARWRERVDRVLQVIADSGRLTAPGVEFVAGMRATVDRWRDESVPAEARTLARDAADDHHIGWQIRNLRPDPAHVRQLAKAWDAGDGPQFGGGAPADVVPSDSRALVHNVRLDLVGLRISDPERFARLRRDPGALAEAVPDATAGDVAYAQGDYTAAIQAYRTLIAAEPAQRSHWAGLALALRRLGASPAATALLRHPELVYAVYQQLADQRSAPAPDELGDWLAGASNDSRSRA